MLIVFFFFYMIWPWYTHVYLDIWKHGQSIQSHVWRLLPQGFAIVPKAQTAKDAFGDDTHTNLPFDHPEIQCKDVDNSSLQDSQCFGCFCTFFVSFLSLHVFDSLISFDSCGQTGVPNLRRFPEQFQLPMWPFFRRKLRKSEIPEDYKAAWGPGLTTAA